MATVLRQKETSKTVQNEDGSLDEQRAPVFVYIHCYNQACIKYHNLQSNLNFEQKVPGIREETIYTYKDRGGDAPGVENSHVRWAPQDSELERCAECGELMNISGTPSYKLTQYGVGPGTGLKGAERAAALAVAEVQAAGKDRDSEITQLQSQLALQGKMLEKLLEAKEEKVKPGPDPTRKKTD